MKLGILDTVSQPTDFGLKRSRVRVNDRVWESATDISGTDNKVFSV